MLNQAAAVSFTGLDADLNNLGFQVATNAKKVWYRGYATWGMGVCFTAHGETCWDVEQAMGMQGSFRECAQPIRDDVTL